ncbi:MAG: hypothetical protein IPI81_11255 [Flavobacteriales bacterium]|nr:hypothetical protein [Flavobacteriales bacterium]
MMKTPRTRKPRKGKHDVELTPFEQEAVKGLYAGKPLLGADGVLSAMVQRIVQASLSGEVQAHLAQPAETSNRRNGYTAKRRRPVLARWTSPPRVIGRAPSSRSWLASDSAC